MRYVWASIIGLIGGISSGLFGVGGGIVMVPAMTFALNTDIKRAVGTSLAVIVPTALTGVFKHHELRQVDWRLAAMLAPAAVIGGFIGPWLTTRLSSPDLQKLFGAFLVLVGLRLVFFTR